MVLRMIGNMDFSTQMYLDHSKLPRYRTTEAVWLGIAFHSEWNAPVVV